MADDRRHGAADRGRGARADRRARAVHAARPVRPPALRRARVLRRAADRGRDRGPFLVLADRRQGALHRGVPGGQRPGARAHDDPEHADARARGLALADRRRGPGRALMTVLQIVALAAVAIGGTAVVLAPDPLRQVLVLGIYGLMLTMLFFVFQDPDVGLSEIVVSTVGLPFMVLLALRKVGEQDRERRRQEEEQE